MELSTLMAFATFLVVGINYSDSVSPAEERLWIQQCSKEADDAPGSSDSGVLATERKEWCYWACLLGKYGMMKDEKLVERKKACDILVGMSNRYRIEIKDGQTFRQLAEQCYDAGNAKTEECEMAGTLVRCLADGMDHVKDLTEE